MPVGTCRMEPSPPPFAILGAGAVTVARHLPALQAVGGRALSIFDPVSDSARLAAAAFGISHVAASYEEAISLDGVEAVLVASPNAFHREQAECALEAGRHVLCEKPVALTLSDARALVEAAQRCERVLQVGFHHRFSAEQLCVKRLIETGILGEVQAFNGVISEPLEVIPGGLRNYRFNARQGGGFTLIDVGQHRIDQIRDLLGEIAAVSCDMASVSPAHNRDDNVILSARMESGAIGALSWHRFSRAFTSPLMLYGTRATLGCSAFITAPYQSAPVSLYLEEDPASALPAEILAWTRPTRWWGDLEAGWVDIWPPRRKTFEAQFRDFFGAIRQGGPPRAGAVDGYKALEAVQAAYRAFRESRTVSLPVSDDTHLNPPSW